jgi:hypothetical protein
LTIHAKRCHNFSSQRARALGDIMSESMGGIISECPGDFIGIGTLGLYRPSGDNCGDKYSVSCQKVGR